MASPSYPSGHRARKLLGFFHRSVSQLDGKPIVVVFTGFSRGSKNAKTGNMVQSWILREDVNPQHAVETGLDFTICGNCRMRPVYGGKCYVSVARAPLAVWKAFKRGRYQELQLADLSAFHGRVLRIGSYGDPVAVPFGLWASLLAMGQLSGWTGYTHSWRHRLAPRYREFLMASVDSPQEFLEASRAGWKCFRTRQPGEAVLREERICPASAEAGHRTTCSRCLACNGSRGHRVIVEHGFRVKATN